MADDPATGCCAGAHGCVFAKALQARTAHCGLARRRAVGEGELLDCGSPVARINCATLAALLHERARFALRLPAPGRALMHVQALKLQCGGLAALRAQLADADADADAGADRDRDVHALVRQAQQQHGSLAELPWSRIVAMLVAWQPRRRRR